MAKKLFPIFKSGVQLAYTEADTQVGTNLARANGTTGAWGPYALSETSPGTLSNAFSAPTTTGPTAGMETRRSGYNLQNDWISLPVAADITISGTMTFNIWAYEDLMTTNATPQVILERLDSKGAVVSTIINKENGVECGTTSAAMNWTGTPTSTAMKRGDRFRLRILANDATGVNQAATIMSIDTSAAAAATGDTWIQFTENVTFEATDPTGTTLYLTDTAGPAVGADLEKEAWTSRGAGVISAVKNTIAGWFTPSQWTDSGAGTNIEWYSRGLTAFTLGGKTKASLWLTTNNTASYPFARLEIAVCNNDGSSPVVWGSAVIGKSAVGNLTTSNVEYFVWVSGPNTAVTNGQRLRFRVLLNNNSSNEAGGASGSTATLSYGATAAGASDSFVILPQTVTEYSASPAALRTNPVVVGQAVRRAATLMLGTRQGWRRTRQGILVPELVV